MNRISADEALHTGLLVPPSIAKLAVEISADPYKLDAWLLTHLRRRQRERHGPILRYTRAGLPNS